MVTVGILALQGGFSEHLSSLQKAATHLSVSSSSSPSSSPTSTSTFDFLEVRTPDQLARCDALVIPGGESTTLSLVAAQSGLLEPLREFVKVNKKPTWGTCAGLILLSEQASATKRGGQELIGGLDVKVHRNHFGRQIESFVTDLDLPFLCQDGAGDRAAPFPAVFIRAPVVEEVLADYVESMEHMSESAPPEIVKPISRGQVNQVLKTKVEVLATLPGRHASNKAAAMARIKTITTPTGNGDNQVASPKGAGDIVALRQGNVFGTSFHPELTDDIRIHAWWLRQI
ncbi:SNO glutamine amidotransferase [Annulohypoxylon maeteangense]|uniref:SNO glutamine amidotransferase n=1 Tax=Annulohypoxylon maeteangense TaxID=1927788 RepID=UPI0020087C55|nr:SNO glutamine amidotransferase [Annulohypoxylon maeteangense]KAI0889506.1 SNO glutamine amidotransferase [Annulohypoxylon maeteangense]